MAPPPSAGNLSSLSSRGLSDGVPPSPSACSPAYRRPDWLLFNDFCITPCASAEVVTLFDNQKVPCLLYYSRVSPCWLRKGQSHNPTQAGHAKKPKVKLGFPVAVLACGLLTLLLHAFMHLQTKCFCLLLGLDRPSVKSLCLTSACTLHACRHVLHSLSP